MILQCWQLIWINKFKKLENNKTQIVSNQPINLEPVYKKIEQLEKEYDNLIQEINNTKSGTEKSLLIASCDYILGRSYRYFKQNEKAIVYFDKAIELCQQILKKTEIVDAYLILADSISQNCSIKPKSYGFSQGTKIRSNAKKALKINAVLLSST